MSGLLNPRCPECGTEFDPNEKGSFANSRREFHRRQWQVRLALIAKFAVAVSAGLAYVWLTVIIVLLFFDWYYDVVPFQWISPMRDGVQWRFTERGSLMIRGWFILVLCGGVVAAFATFQRMKEREVR